MLKRRSAGTTWDARGQLIEVIKKCDARFKQSMSVVSKRMIAIVLESIPELSYIKDFESDYQV